MFKLLYKAKIHNKIQNLNNIYTNKIRNKSFKDSLADTLTTIAISIGLFVFITTFIVTPNQVEGMSMSPNFETGDIILTNRLSYWIGQTEVGKLLHLDYQRGDVIVFKKPNNHDLIKRIIGLPGENIAIRNGKVYINGKELKEKYLPENVYTTGHSFIQNNGKEILIQPNTYVVMGDNRQDSHDSRYLDIGLVKREWIKGKVILRYWPINKFGIIYSGQFNFEE
ncbi:MAG: signal peptidase I [Candidatus Dojkabacteria bacterium]|nr:signal peptidase I [Candidatus Dojkabacteria bacterium]